MGFPVKVPLNQSIDFTMGNPQAMAMAQQSWAMAMASIANSITNYQRLCSPMIQNPFREPQSFDA